MAQVIVFKSRVTDEGSSHFVRMTRILSSLFPPIRVKSSTLVSPTLVPAAVQATEEALISPER